jgi:hypothetical protein
VIAVILEGPLMNLHTPQMRNTPISQHGENLMPVPFSGPEDHQIWVLQTGCRSVSLGIDNFQFRSEFQLKWLPHHPSSVEAHETLYFI